MRVSQREFGEMVRRHQSMVFSIAVHMIRDWNAAEDIAQDVFLAMHQSLGAIDSEAHLVSWLRRVACQRAIDHCRKQRYRRHSALELVPEPAAVLTRADPLERDLLWRMVNRLPPRSRAIVVLRYQEDLAPPEIAAVLDLPLATVKSQLHRALGVLRLRMEGCAKGKGALQ